MAVNVFVIEPISNTASGATPRLQTPGLTVRVDPDDQPGVPGGAAPEDLTDAFFDHPPKVSGTTKDRLRNRVGGTACPPTCRPSRRGTGLKPASGGSDRARSAPERPVREVVYGGSLGADVFGRRRAAGERAARGAKGGGAADGAASTSPSCGAPGRRRRALAAGAARRRVRLGRRQAELERLRRPAQMRRHRGGQPRSARRSCDAGRRAHGVGRWWWAATARVTPSCTPRPWTIRRAASRRRRSTGRRTSGRPGSRSARGRCRRPTRARRTRT